MDDKCLKWLDMTRVDIKNQGGGNDVKLKVISEEQCNVIRPRWFSKNGIGYVLETDAKHLILELECVGAGELTVRLRGIDRNFPGEERLPLWVDYNRLAVNDEIIFWETKPCWHNKSYIFNRQVADREKLRVEISWSNHPYKNEELNKLLTMWRPLDSKKF